MTPPKWSRYLLARAARPRDREFVLADLDAEFDRLARADGAAAARRWYRRQARHSLVPLLRSRFGAAGAPRERVGARSFLETAWQDLRHGVRRLCRTPLTTSAVVATCGLGIGANAAMFSFASAVLIRPLPLADPDRLVRVYQSAIQTPDNVEGLSPPDFRALHDEQHAFAALAGFQTMADGFSMTVGDHAEQVPGVRVTADFFDVLGVAPLVGSTCRAGDDRPGAPPRAVVGETFWRTRLGADTSIAGRRVRLNGRAVEVAGVMPAGFWFPRGDYASVWLCIPGPWTYDVFGRLRDGATAAEVRADLDRFVAAHSVSGGMRWTLTTRPLKAVLVGDLEAVLWLLAAAVVIVLGIACVNATNLLLARAWARQRELSLQIALGASRAHLVRQAVTEHLVLAVACAAAGLLLAHWTIPVFVAALPRDLQTLRDAQIAIDGRVLAWTSAIGVLSAAIWGSWPVLAAFTPRLNPNMAEGGRSVLDGPGRGGMRRLLVVAQFSMAVVLLVGAGLVLRSLDRLQRVDSGVQPAHVTTATIALPPVRAASPDATIAFYDRVLAGVKALPHVRSAAVSFGLPPDRVLNSLSFETPAHPDAPLKVQLVTVSGEYFAALGIPVVQGRSFDAHDVAKSTPVVIVNETLARRLVDGGNPVGRTFLQSGGAAITVVGVVKNVKYTGLGGAAEPTAYIPFAQGPFGYMAVVVRSDTDPGPPASALRDLVAAIDRDAAVGQVMTMDERLWQSVGRPRFTTMLFASLALLALVLAAIGVCSVLTHAVSQRTREIGVRMALGARPSGIASLVVREGLWAAGIGVAVGLLAALAGTRLMHTLLFDVTPTDLATFVAVPVALLGAAALASWLPARRAMRVDPITILRRE
jgi:putative ABC transport system permease protein